MHQIWFRLGHSRKSRWQTLQRSPGPLTARFKGPTSKTKKKGNKRKGRKRDEVGWDPPSKALNTLLIRTGLCLFVIVITTAKSLKIFVTGCQMSGHHLLPTLQQQTQIYEYRPTVDRWNNSTVYNVCKNINKRIAVLVKQKMFISINITRNVEKAVSSEWGDWLTGSRK